MSSDLSDLSHVPDFAELGVPGDLVAVLDDAGITTPTPIQAATLADSLAGRDVLARGRTGSGKTYAFAIPMVARLAAATGPKPHGPHGLILAPTRELARQIDETLAPLAKAAGLTTTVVFGGVSTSRQIDVLRRGVDIVVACPGRLEDLIGQKAVSLQSVRVTVLDEADHMADLGFLPAVRRLLSQTPADGQRLLFSATLDQAVDALASKFLHDPVRHSADAATATPGPTEHHLITVDGEDRVRVIAELVAAHERTVVFTRTKHGAKRLAKQLTAAGVQSVDLHGNLGQNARVRNLEAFASGAAPVLVATDIAARGIHVDDVSLVVHADPPTEHKAYVHRSGRTARAGAVGTVASVATRDQIRDYRPVLRSAGVTPTETTIRGGARVRLGDGDELTPLVREVVPMPTPAGGGSGQGSGGGSRTGGGSGSGGGSRRGRRRSSGGGGGQGGSAQQQGSRGGQGSRGAQGGRGGQGGQGGRSGGAGQGSRSGGRPGASSQGGRGGSAQGGGRGGQGGRGGAQQGARSGGGRGRSPQGSRG